MGILFDLKKKSLLRKIDKARVKSLRLSATRRKEASQERDLVRLQNEIKVASKIRVSKSDAKLLAGKKVKSKAKIARIKKDVRLVGKEGFRFAVNLSKFINKNVAPPKRRKVKKRGVKRGKRRGRK